MTKGAKKRDAAIIESAKPYLEPGEEVRAVFMGQTFISPIWYLTVVVLVLVPVFALLGLLKEGAILVTDRNAYQFSLGRFSVRKVKAMLHKDPLGKATADEGFTWSLKVGKGPRLDTAGSTDRKGVAALINGARRD